jgi:hypothetical protein
MGMKEGKVCMSIFADDWVRIVVRMTDINGSSIQNAYHYQHTGSGSVAEGAFLIAVESEMASMYGYIEDNIPDSLTPLDITCDVVDFSGGELVVLRNVGTIAFTTWNGGTATGDGLPQGNAAVVNLPTYEAGVLGRKYIGPLVEAVQNNGILGSGILADLATYAADFIGGFDASAEPFSPGVMSTKLAQGVLIASAVLNAVVGYQRRRKSGVGQ